MNTNTSNTGKFTALKQLDERLRRLPAWVSHVTLGLCSFGVGALVGAWAVALLVAHWVNHILKYGTLCAVLAIPASGWTQERPAQPATNEISLCHALVAAGVATVVTIGGVKVYYYIRAECVKIERARSNAFWMATNELACLTGPGVLRMPVAFCEAPPGEFELVTTGDDEAPVVLCHTGTEGEWRGCVDLPAVTCRKVWIRAATPTSQTK